MARQAGRLLAELRRASNEFKSQIETEIAHLEVEKTETVLPPSPPPQGTVASVNSNHATDDNLSQQHEPPMAADAPMDQITSAQAAPAESNPAASQSSTAPAEAVAEPSASTSQESHV